MAEAKVEGLISAEICDGEEEAQGRRQESAGRAGEAGAQVQGEEGQMIGWLMAAPFCAFVAWVGVCSGMVLRQTGKDGEPRQ